MSISASVVIYNSPLEEVKECIDSFIANGGYNIIIIDNNSINDTCNQLESIYHEQNNVKFLRVKTNKGYGSGHNLGIKHLVNTGNVGKYHIILNPDIIIQKNCLRVLTDYCDQSPDVALCVPKILNPDGTLQPLNKEHPTVFDMFIRRFIPKFLNNLLIKRYNYYIRMNIGYDAICNVPFASGCFMFFRTETFLAMGGFDEKFFLYMEDADISRRTWQYGKVVYNPDAKVIHKWKRESHKSLKMTLIMVRSMFVYFGKHGWRIV